MTKDKWECVGGLDKMCLLLFFFFLFFLHFFPFVFYLNMHRTRLDLMSSLWPLFPRVETEFCVPSFWATTRVRPSSTTTTRVGRHVCTSPRQRASVTSLMSWQECPSVTCRLWMWMTGIRGHSGHVGDYQSSLKVNLKIKNMVKGLSYMTISSLPVMFTHVLVTIKTALF